jgi:hypothetical protein
VAHQPADVSGASSRELRQTAIAAPPADSLQQAAGERLKIGGWLAFFCFGLVVLAPLHGLREINQSLDQPFLVVLEVGLVAFSIYTGIALTRVRPNAMRLVKIFFIVMLALGILSVLGSFASDSGDKDALVAGLGTIGSAAIWWSYFRKSKRVRDTFGSNL